MSDATLAKETSSPAFYLSGNPASRLLIVADHASPLIPPNFDALGLSPEDLARHIAYDIGTFDLAHALALKLDARIITCGFSRLFADVNRPEGHETVIPEISDGTRIPGNQALSIAQCEYRYEHYHRAYHHGLAKELERIEKSNGEAALVSIHSFTPVMAGVTRPWHGAMLSNRDERMVNAILDVFARFGDFKIGHNVPYSGRVLNHTMDVHAEAFGRPYATVEVRQDELVRDGGIQAWSTLLENALRLTDETLELKLFRD